MPTLHDARELVGQVLHIFPSNDWQALGVFATLFATVVALILGLLPILRSAHHDKQLARAIAVAIRQELYSISAAMLLIAVAINKQKKEALGRGNDFEELQEELGHIRIMLPAYMERFVDRFYTSNRLAGSR